jgi:single-strand selective monofunctional uracil DNA glycosylase
MRFGAPAAFVYDPLVYAWDGYRQYLEKFARGPREVVLVGMNPGPFGMAQTGVPFGEVRLVTTWMGIRAEIGRPAREHPARPIQGYSCARSEVSGARLWGAIAKKHPDPATFFARALVINYCPLLFLEESGRNLTPDKLARADRAPLEAACDAHLLRALTVLEPRVVLGVGGWAEKRARQAARAAAARLGHDVAVACLPHPSPASPQANRGWDALARRALVDAGIEPFL